MLEPRELVIGTYTGPLPHIDGKAEGILSCSFDGTTVGPPFADDEVRSEVGRAPALAIARPGIRRL